MGDALPKRSTRRRLRQTKPPKLTNATPSPEREFAHLAPELDVVRPTRETHGALVADAIKNCSRRCQRRLETGPLGRLKTDPPLDEQAATRGALR